MFEKENNFLEDEKYEVLTIYMADIKIAICLKAKRVILYTGCNGYFTIARQWLCLVNWLGKQLCTQQQQWRHSCLALSSVCDCPTFYALVPHHCWLCLIIYSWWFDRISTNSRFCAEIDDQVLILASICWKPNQNVAQQAYALIILPDTFNALARVVQIAPTD